MTDWSTIHPDRIRIGKNEQGKRLIELFSLDFEENMGRKINISCPKCFSEELQKFLNHNTMADDKKKLDWEVKPMYNGLSLGFGSKVILSNEHLTAEIAEKFANEHPKGLELFTKYPDDFEPKAPETDRLKELKKLNREQLNEIYGEGAETFANKGEIIAAIIASEETED